MVDMIYVDSSNVDQIGFDEYQGEVHVIFKSGHYYIYSDVSIETWDRFRNATSKGIFLNEEFKFKRYPYREN